MESLSRKAFNIVINSKKNGLFVPSRIQEFPQISLFSRLYITGAGLTFIGAMPVAFATMGSMGRMGNNNITADRAGTIVTATASAFAVALLWPIGLSYIAYLFVNK